MNKTSNKLQRFVALLSASDPDAVDRCGAQEKFGVWIQAIPLVLTPLFGFAGAAYAVHDMLVARPRGEALPAPALLLVPLVAGLFWGTLLFALDWMIVRSLDGSVSGRRKVAIVLPRLLLAAFAAYLVAVPVKAFLFQDEIRKFLLDEKLGKKAVAVSGSSEQLAAGKEPLVATTSAVERLSERLRGTPDAPEYLAAKAAVANLEPALDGVTRRVLALRQGAELLERQLTGLDPVSPEHAALEGRIAAARAAWSDRRAERASLAARLSSAHAQARRAEEDWRSSLRTELTAAENERGEYSRTFQELLRADQAERSRVTAELDATYEQTGFVGKIVALYRLSSQSRPHALLMLGVYALFLLIDLAPALVKLTSKRDEYDSASGATGMEKRDRINRNSNHRASLHARVADLQTRAAEQTLANIETELDKLGPDLGPVKAVQLANDARKALDVLR